MLSVHHHHARKQHQDAKRGGTEEHQTLLCLGSGDETDRPAHEYKMMSSPRSSTFFSIVDNFLFIVKQRQQT